MTSSRSTSPPTPAASAPTSSRCTRAAELEQAIKEAKAAPADGGPVVIHVETDPLVYAPDSEAWWDVPVSEVSELDSTQDAYRTYRRHKATQRPLITPTIAEDQS